jgi:hypothetical protein
MYHGNEDSITHPLPPNDGMACWSHCPKRVRPLSPKSAVRIVEGESASPLAVSSLTGKARIAATSRNINEVLSYSCMLMLSHGLSCFSCEISPGPLRVSFIRHVHGHVDRFARAVGKTASICKSMNTALCYRRFLIASARRLFIAFIICRFHCIGNNHVTIRL